MFSLKVIGIPSCGMYIEWTVKLATKESIIDHPGRRQREAYRVPVGLHTPAPIRQSQLPASATCWPLMLVVLWDVSATCRNTDAIQPSTEYPNNHIIVEAP